MSDVLTAVREKYPVYKDVPDEQLVSALGDKYPVYLKQDPQFFVEYQRSKGQIMRQPESGGAAGEMAIPDPRAKQTPQLLTPGPSALDAGQVPWQQERVVQAAQTEQAQRAAQDSGQAGQIGPVDPLTEQTTPIQLPRAGQPGSVVRGVSDVAAGLGEFVVNKPEEFLASVYPPTAVAVLARYAPGIAKEFAINAYKGVQGDKEALGRAGAMAAMVGLPFGAKEAMAFKNRIAPKEAPAPAEAPKTPHETLLPRSAAAVEALNKGETPNEAQIQNQNVQEIVPQEGQGIQNVPAQEEALTEKPAPVAPGQAPEVPAPTETAVTAADTAGADTPAASQAISQSTPETSAAQPAATGEAKPEAAGPDISVGPGAASRADVPETGAGGEKYGVAQRVREERAKAGQVGEVLPGKGIGAEESVVRGRELLASGADPEAALKNFEATGRASPDDFMLTRAHGEQLAIKARRIEGEFGTESPEFKAAQDALTNWDTRTKKMATEAHKQFMSLQGETDLDTGSFSGLQRAFKQDTGKDFTPGQAETAKKKAAKSQEASDQATAAKQKLFEHVQNKRDLSAAEKSALDAAMKVVIDWDVTKARLESKLQVADAKRATRLAEINRELEAKVKAAADKVTRDAAVREAKKAREAAEKTAKLEKEQAQVQLKAEKKALDAANKVVRENAIRNAKIAANKPAEDAKRAAKIAKIEQDLEAKIKATTDKRTRDAAIGAAKKARQDIEDRADVPTYAWKLAKEYIEQGVGDFDELRHKIATDMGIPVEDVTRAMARDKRAKYLMDEAWKAQQRARQIKNQTKQWVRDQAVPGYLMAINRIPRVLFSLKVGFHGTVALGTHAPMVAFQPRFWSAYVRDFGKMYRMVGSPLGQGKAQAYYEMQVQDLLRRPNYMVARRAGLINDPFQFEDYNSPDTSSYFGKITTMGNRGYSVLKILRQDMFDQHWNQLPKTARIPEMAAALADGINHATGVVQGKAPPGTNVALFAPRLEASRVMWLAGDPLKAANTFLNWKNADLADKAFALNQIKEKAWVAGTMLSALALNQGFLYATGSKQRVNVTNPMESDFLRFKVGGMAISYGSAMVNMAKLPGKLALAIAFRGKLGKVVLEDERVSKVLFDYARSQASPFASTAIDLATGRDYAERPLPRKLFGTLPGDRDIPKRLRMHGISQPYSWTEWASEEFSPIPIEEGLKEVWAHQGMDERQQKTAMKALLTISFMAATGGRLTEDWQLKKQE